MSNPHHGAWLGPEDAEFITTENGMPHAVTTDGVVPLQPVSFENLLERIPEQVVTKPLYERVACPECHANPGEACGLARNRTHGPRAASAIDVYNEGLSDTLNSVMTMLGLDKGEQP